MFDDALVGQTHDGILEETNKYARVHVYVHLNMHVNKHDHTTYKPNIHARYDKCRTLSRPPAVREQESSS